MTLKEFLNAVENGDKIRFKTWVLSSDFIYFDTRLKKWLDDRGKDFSFTYVHWKEIENFELYKEPELTQEELKTKYNFKKLPSCFTCKIRNRCIIYNTGNYLSEHFVCDAWES